MNFMKRCLIALAAMFAVGGTAEAAVTYEFSFTNIARFDGVVYDDFSVVLASPTYLTTSDFSPIGTTLHTSLGYDATYAGALKAGRFLFTPGNGSISDPDYLVGGPGFAFEPTVLVSNYYQSVGTYTGYILGNAPATSYGSIFGAAVLKITDTSTSAVPEPQTWAMMLIGFCLIGGALRNGPGKKAPLYNNYL